VIEVDLDVVAGLFAGEWAAEEGRLAFVVFHPEVGKSCICSNG